MVLSGIANGVYHPSDYALLSRGVAPDRMGRAFSVHTFAGFLGNALAPFTLVWIAMHYGMRPAFALSALIGLAVLALLALRGQALARLTMVPKAASGAAHQIAIPRAAMGAIAVLLIFFLLLSLGTGAIERFLVAALMEGFGVALPIANHALTAFLFASAFGVLAGGVLADRTDRHGLVGAVVFGLAALLIVAVVVIPMPGLMLIATLTLAGFLTGCIAPSRDMLVRAAAPAGAEGRVFGIVTTGFSIGGVAGPLLFGYLLDRGLAAGVLWASAGFMVATCVIALAQEAAMRRRRIVLQPGE